MATTKQTNPKNTELESDVLKAAGNAAPPVNQQAIKDQAQAIGDQANKAETIQGKTETMQGEPGPGIQLPGTEGNAAPVSTTHTAGAVDPLYTEFLAWKKQQEDNAQALNTAPAGTVTKQPSDYDAKRQAAEEAARKAYNDVMDAPQTTPHPDPDGEIKSLNANKVHEERVRLYGEGYVVAQRKGVTQVFTRTTWNLLGGRNNSDGYTEVVATPPEIANLKKHQ